MMMMMIPFLSRFRFTTISNTTSITIFNRNHKIWCELSNDDDGDDDDDDDDNGDNDDNCDDFNDDDYIDDTFLGLLRMMPLCISTLMFLHFILEICSNPIVRPSLNPSISPGVDQRSEEMEPF